MTLRIEVDPIFGEAPLHNLVASAVDLSGDRKDRWEMGITWQASQCLEAIPFRQICDTEVALTGVGDPGLVDVYDPNEYYLPYDCGTRGSNERGGDDELKEQVRRGLEVAAIKAFETDFWVILQNNTPIASGQDADATGGVLNPDPLGDATPVSPEVALLQLSQARANCGTGARGMIHAPPYLVEAWAARGYLRENEDNGRLVTRSRGDVVVAGSGYTGQGPTGHPAETPPSGNTWAYTSPMVGVIRSKIIFVPSERADAVDYAANVIRWMARQTIAAQVDSCCTFASLVDAP